MEAYETNYKVCIDLKLVRYDSTNTDYWSYTVALYDSNNTELDTFSTAVEDDKFSGTFESLSNGDYTVTCANYEGGEKKSATAKVTDSTVTNNNTTNSNTSNSNATNNTKADNPKTLDNIKLFVGIFAVSIVLIAGLIIVKKKINK